MKTPASNLAAVRSRTASFLVGVGVAIVVVGTEAFDKGGDFAAMARMTSGEVSVLHALLFIATVWIVSSLRINRLRALWRVGFGLKRMRGASGGLPPRGPKARAATGGSVGGAGASGLSPPIVDNFRN
jgi:hypothetical protein